MATATPKDLANHYCEEEGYPLPETIKHWFETIDLTFLDDFDIKAFERDAEIDELVIDLMNYIKNVEYCDEILRNGFGDN